MLGAKETVDILTWIPIHSVRAGGVAYTSRFSFFFPDAPALRGQGGCHLCTKASCLACTEAHSWLRRRAKSKTRSDPWEDEGSWCAAAAAA